MARFDQLHFRFIRDDARLTDGRRRTPLGAFDFAVAMTLAGHWGRVVVNYGEAPGSLMLGRHLASSVTRVDGMIGASVRFGWWPRPCVTLSAYTRPVSSSPYMAGPWAQAAYEAAVEESHER